MNDFLRYLRKLSQNKLGKKARDYCERILGLNGIVNDFAAFADKHEESMMIAVAAILAKWESEKEFSKDELAIYRLALTEIPLFFLQCKAERDRKHDEELKHIQEKLDNDRQLFIPSN